MDTRGANVKLKSNPPRLRFTDGPCVGARLRVQPYAGTTRDSRSSWARSRYCTSTVSSGHFHHGSPSTWYASSPATSSSAAKLGLAGPAAGAAATELAAGSAGPGGGVAGTTGMTGLESMESDGATDAAGPALASDAS